jgi:acyl-[acyl-carrier-protein] desaturase
LKDSIIREQQDRAYVDFFKLAELRRRWNVFTDIPWDELDLSKASAATLLAVEHSCAEEMYLPDYSSNATALFRRDFGPAWFQACWSYEESKHSLVLREYLLHSGLRSREQIVAFETEVLAVKWRLPFATSRQMYCYGAIQEAATFLGYKTLKDRAIAANDRVLGAIFTFISRDEAAHAGFYRTLLGIEFSADRTGTIADLAYVISEFKMPGDGIIPNYKEKLRSSGMGLTPRSFLENVLLPTLKTLGTSWREMKAALPERAMSNGGLAIA